MTVHAYNPSYLGGWGRRITSLRTAWATYLVSKKKNLPEDIVPGRMLSWRSQEGLALNLWEGGRD